MKRLIAIVVLCFLATATAGLWARSYAVSDEYPAVMHGAGVQIRSWHGRLFFQHVALKGTFAAPHELLIVRAETQIQGIDCPMTQSLNSELRRTSAIQDVQVITAPRITVWPATWWNGFGFATAWASVATTGTNNSLYFRTIAVPYWIVFAVLMLIARMLMSPIRKRRARRRAGQCVQCGYDLRASVDRCPECGTGKATI